MKLKTETAETDFIQSAVDHLKCRCLLGDEENRLFLSQQVRDKVGDTLAFAGPRWADHDKILATVGCCKRCHLR